MRTALSSEAWKKICSVAVVILTWFATTYIFWTGYVGSDDMFYARYAFLLHRPPINWWEFRIPTILAMRASFLTFGPSEVAAALPTLLASLAILASVAWFVQWPVRLTWQTQTAVLLAATLPLDVSFRSVPGAIFVAGGFLIVGTVCLLKGGERIQLLGAALLAAGFATHELSLFYVAIFCFTALAFDKVRFWRPVLACVAISACWMLAECVAYQVLLGDPLARFKTSAAAMAKIPFAYDPDTGISGVRFFTWPLEKLLFSKIFGFDLLLLLITGMLAWKIFSQNQRIVFVSAFLTGAWLAYGTQVPWAYQPLLREMHYYTPLALAVSALLPTSVGYMFANRKLVAQGVIGATIAVHLACSAGGGRWGQDVDVSGELLRYAKEHSNQVFLTDVTSMNEMYVLAGFRLPANVVCVNGPAVENILLVNKEPPGAPRFHFPELRPDGVLVNLEHRTTEAEFTRYVQEHAAQHERIAPVRYKLLFLPLVRWLGPKDFMVRNWGGEMARSVTEPRQ
jgi:hypothetical protein